MLSPLSDYQMGLRPRPKSGRKPLQPKNDIFSNTTININTITTSKSRVPMKPTPDRASVPDYWNKENAISKMDRAPLPEEGKPDVKIINIEPFEASLADELTAIRKKMERLKLDKDNTDTLLKERDLMLDMQMNQLQLRGEAQKHLEIQVDRLFRLNELRLSCMKTSQIKSLREKKEEKTIMHEEDQQKKVSTDDTESDTITAGDQMTTMKGQDGVDCN